MPGMDPGPHSLTFSDAIAFGVCHAKYCGNAGICEES